LVLDPTDREFLRGLDGLVTVDKIELPSGRVIDPPKPGAAWEISGGAISKKISQKANQN
jgi:hypothetical protein